MLLLVILLVASVMLVGLKVYRIRRPKRGPIRSSRRAKTRVNSPPYLPPPGM